MGFFNGNGCSVLIALAVSLVFWVVFKFIKNLPTYVVNYAPMLSALIISIACDMIFVSHAFTLSETAFERAILSASFTTVFTVFIKRAEKGDFPLTEISVMVIEGLLTGYIEKDNISLVSANLISILESNGNTGGDNQNTDIKEQIYNILDEHLAKTIPEEEKYLLISSILTSVETLKNTKKR